MVVRWHEWHTRKCAAQPCGRGAQTSLLDRVAVPSTKLSAVSPNVAALLERANLQHNVDEPPSRASTAAQRSGHPQPQHGATVPLGLFLDQLHAGWSTGRSAAGTIRAAEYSRERCWAGGWWRWQVVKTLGGWRRYEAVLEVGVPLHPPRAVLCYAPQS
ncbi:hypothetical protein HaLaN_04252 [Haematococcus lacustris]|uniref:Uncharacterized protein n=1 Tax=Haematococcus lacustris TaxID=44745 RepID=A0A699YGA7_HAELA|nr:hypothetical protein HaLaN_04252 [Haematococcus lacustris]